MVQLLVSDNDPALNAQLEPFLLITECVKESNLGEYMRCLAAPGEQLRQCGLSCILLRLRKINKNYSPIGLAEKLALSVMENTFDIG